MRERAGLLLSSAAHAALIAYAFIGLSSAKPFEVGPTEALPIEIMSPQEFDAMTKGSKTSKKVDAPKVKAEKVAQADPDPSDDDLPIKKEDVKAPPPPKADAAPPPPPKPDPKLEAEKAEKAEAEKAAKAEAAKAEAAKAEAAKAAAAKAAQEKAEKIAAAEAAEAELRAKEKAEKEAKAEAEKEAKEKAEKIAKAEAEKAAREKAEAEKQAKLEAEKAAKEKAEKLAKLEAEKAAKEKAEKQAKLEAEKKAAERKFDPNKIAALLPDKPSKSNSESALQDQRDPGRKERGARETAPETTAGTSRGTASKLSMSQRVGIDNAVREQVSQCWSPPVGASAGDNLIVRVRFTLNADGTLQDGPTVDSGSAPRAFADAAARAVRRCAPLKLPPEAYDYWRSVDIRFDPKDMMGG